MVITKSLSVAIVLLAAAPFVSAARGQLRLESRPEPVSAVVDQVGVDGLSAWVVETHNPPTPTDLRVRPAARRSASGATSAGPSVANRNRNPLNIKVGQITRRYIDAGTATISDISPLDGGRFLRFHSPEAGFKAALDVLTSAAYRDLDLDRAFLRWSNGGFGSEILAGTRLAAGATIAQLRPEELTLLLRAMAAAEGYRSPTIADEIARARP